MAFHAGGGGYGLNKMSTLQFMDEERVRAEIAARQLFCEVPECDKPAVMLARSGVTILMCRSHNDAYLSSPAIAKAIIKSMRVWLQYHLTDILRHAYEGQEDNVLLVVSDDALNGPYSMLDQARDILKGADKIASQMARMVEASNAPPILIVKIVETPKVRPSISTLSPSNVHPGMQLFD